ncbi:MAG: DUF4293 domain-containing protein [Duncaniella sp.]|uniref:DUF4293 family protein n=1 Tax=Duncaniella sp. TaxID=2518496 RepID=UPI0023D7083A|nr:DUF4293 family protein [Duncaniella sp.]MDE5989418.1 DUF4293 domain-containing protein [Duncaniella sp.]
MQIQRIQTVYIFLAMVAMMIFVIVPYGEVDYLSGQTAVTEKLYTMYEYGLLIPAAATVILLIVDIFLFRNLSLQRRVLTISLLLTLCCIAVVCFILFKQAGAEGMDAHFAVWDILLPVAVILEILGLGGIAKDIKLLNSYNRLR